MHPQRPETSIGALLAAIATCCTHARVRTLAHVLSSNKGRGALWVAEPFCIRLSPAGWCQHPWHQRLCMPRLQNDAGTQIGRLCCCLSSTDWRQPGACTSSTSVDACLTCEQMPSVFWGCPPCKLMPTLCRLLFHRLMPVSMEATVAALYSIQEGVWWVESGKGGGEAQQWTCLLWLLYAFCCIRC